MASAAVEIYPIDSKPFGKSYSEWCSDWWKWLLSIPLNKNPSRDKTGSYASVKQPYRFVFFLCQTIEGKRPFPNRSIGIDNGQCVFTPVINWLSVSGIDGETEHELRKVAREKIDVVSKLRLNIDGVTIREELRKFRVRSNLFSIELAANNVLELEPGRRTCISDGYWIFTKPLSDSLILSTEGMCSSGETNIGVNYAINLD